MNHTKKIIAGLGIAGSLAFGSQMEVNPKPLNVNEWQSLVQVYNYEIAQNQGTITIQKFKDFSDLNDEIRKRTPTETVVMEGKNVSPNEYKKIRENLINKVEPKTILEVILN